MSVITNARSLNKRGSLTVGALAGLLVFGRAATVFAATPCGDAFPTPPVHPIYGAGGSAVTATLGKVASALAGLAEADRVTLFYWDKLGACGGYRAFAKFDATPTSIPFQYWEAGSTEPKTCDFTPPEGFEFDFAHMGNTPNLCPGKPSLPAGYGRFTAPVQTVNLITHASSQYDAISAEAFYFVAGFGPGAAGHAVAPWTVPEATFARTTSSFVHQFLAKAFNVPSTGFKFSKVLKENKETVDAVIQWGTSNDPSQALGYVSGSAADAGEDEGQIKTLAVQYYGQSCGYLPDSTRTRKDRLNVRNGQYPLFTPGQFYGKVDGGGKLSHPSVSKLVHWFDGSLPAPGGLDITKIIIESGDVPLCAMHATRPDGDFEPVVSYAPPIPCDGYFEQIATGSTTHVACVDDNACKVAAGEKCHFGFCEAY